MFSPHRIDLNLLQVFVTIYREGSLTRASHVLHLTQPAVSHSLARLRGQFNDPLFLRQGNRMAPTPLARRLADSVLPGLSDIQTALNQFEAFEPQHQAKVFNLALRDVMETTFLPPLMRDLMAYPAIEIVSQRIARRDMEQQLAAGTVDFAVDVLLPVSEQTAHEHLHKDQLVVVAASDHPLVSQGMDLAAYLQARHVLVSSRAEGPGIEDFALSAQGARRQIAMRCQHYFAACRVAEQTQLLVTMPEAYARTIVRHLEVALLPAPAELPAVDVHLYWHRQYEREPALQWFRERLRQRFIPGLESGQT